MFRLASVVRAPIARAATTQQRTVLASIVPCARAATRSFADDSSSRFVPKPVFSSFKVYKTKTALDVSPIKAQLAWNSPKVEERKYLALKRAGGFRLTFAAGENKNYDWENSALITLGVTELGDILAFAGNKEQAEHKIFHDPGLGGESAGKMRKELVVKRIGQGKPGYFFNFAVTKEAEAARKWSIAVSEGEFQVILSLIQHALPQLLAFNVKAGIATEEEGGWKKRGDTESQQ